MQQHPKSLKELRHYFFQTGKDENMSFSLTNFKQELIIEVLVNGSKLPFTLQRSINSTKLPKVRLYLASKSNPGTKEEGK